MFSINTVQGWLFYFKMKKEFYKEDEIVFQEKPNYSRFINIEGVAFGNLMVLGYAGKFGTGKKWYCKCRCGNVVSVFYCNLSNGDTTSCGCVQKMMLKKARTTHGLDGTPIYRVWGSMKARCNNPAHKYFKDYGARGIKLCDRWDKFENFLEDMGDRPGDWASIDRIDNNKGYEPGNCRWATQKEQCNNKRDNVLVTYNGETKTITQWCECMGISFRMLQNRISKGWDPDRALNQPSRFKKRNAPQS